MADICWPGARVHGFIYLAHKFAEREIPSVLFFFFVFPSYFFIFSFSFLFFLLSIFYGWLPLLCVRRHLFAFIWFSKFQLLVLLCIYLVKHVLAVV